MNKAQCRLYEIEMGTPLGQRTGLLSVCKDGEKLCGDLTILQHTEPYEGKSDADGNCRISGKIITLTRTLLYVATGKISDEGIALSLAAACGDYQQTFAIIGKLRREEGVQQ